MNRGIARRTMFERRSDMRHFLALVARAVRAGHLEVHAYCLMGTHYHLLVRSPAGRLADAMHGIQLGYSRYFNRGRHRDGPLVRSRYRSRPVLSGTYRRLLVSYIDSNPVRGRLVPAAHDYPHGSAYHYARGPGPRWLQREWVEGVATRLARGTRFSPRAYRAAFRPLPDDLHRVAEARIASRVQADPLEDLVRNAQPDVLGWMRRKAALADGTAPGLPVCDRRVVEQLVSCRAHEEWTLEGTRWDGWTVLRVALRVELCGETRTAIAGALECSDSRVGAMLRFHRRLLELDQRYAERLQSIARQALENWKDLRR